MKMKPETITLTLENEKEMMAMWHLLNTSENQCSEIIRRYEDGSSVPAVRNAGITGGELAAFAEKAWKKLAALTGW